MHFSTWKVDFRRALIGVAVHNGHDLRAEVREVMKLDDSQRLREEDPHTGCLAAYLGSYVVVNRSRFEVDLNRPPAESVYVEPEDSWGLPVWRVSPSAELISASRHLHRRFYGRLREVLDELTRRHGGFVLYDIHSYNHRRPGPDHPPERSADNPVVNLGTGSLPDHWRPVACAFLESMRSNTVGGDAIDARENVRFRGRYVARFVHDNYGQVGCALAIEFKKVFVDEWTHAVDHSRLVELGIALAASEGPVEQAWEAICR